MLDSIIFMDVYFKETDYFLKASGYVPERHK